MGYAVAAVLILFALAIIGRLLARHTQPASFPASELLRREPPRLAAAGAQLESPPALATASNDAQDGSPQPTEPATARRGLQGTTVKLQAAPGAPNVDPPTDHHVSHRGSATITRRTGRRRSTTST